MLAARVHGYEDHKLTSTRPRADDPEPARRTSDGVEACATDLHAEGTRDSRLISRTSIARSSRRSCSIVGNAAGTYDAACGRWRTRTVQGAKHAAHDAVSARPSTTGTRHA